MSSDGLDALAISSGNHLIDGLIFLAIVIVPLWLILHYVAKLRASRQLNTRDAPAFEDLNRIAVRMEQRIATLERILDAESPNWRHTADLGARDHEPI
jgi:phage shock protein B